MNQIRLTDAYGRAIPFTVDKIKSALVGRNAGVTEMCGEASVWAADPVMVLIYRVRNSPRGPFHHEVTEIAENCRGKMVDILHLEFRDEELNEAIEIFMKLCIEPKKVFQGKLLERMGGHAIFLHNIATEGLMG